MELEKAGDFFIPKTTLGKWSVGLIFALFLLFWMFQLLVASGQRGGETFFDNPYLSVTILLIGTVSKSAFFTGIISIIKDKERSLPVFLSSISGILVMFFVVGEFLFPQLDF